MSTSTAGGVSVVFTAETAQFTSALKKIDGAVESSSRAQQAASDRLMKAWNQELLMQDRLAQKQEQTARAKELAALKSDILARSEEQAANQALQSERSYARLIQSLNSTLGITESVTAANRGLAASHEMVAAAAGHQVPAMAASSGALRLLEGDYSNNIRAAERFVGTTLGLSPILEAAFPVVGAIALGGALVEMGKKAYDVEQDFVNLKSAIEGLNEIQITVDKKLTTVGDSIEDQVEKVLEKTQGKSASLQQKYQYQAQKPIDLSDYFYDDKFKKLPDDVKGNYETLYKSIAPADLPGRLAQIRKEVVDLKDAADFVKSPASFGMVMPVSGRGPDTGRNPADYFDARLKAASQIKSQLEAQADLHGAQDQGLQMDVSDQQQKDRDDAQRKAEEAARKGQAARRKAAEDQHKQMESQLSDLKNDHQLTTVEEYNFWASMLGAARSYPDNLAKVRERMGELYQEMGRELTEYGKKYDEENKQRLEKQKQWDSEANRLSDEMDAQERRTADFTSRLAAVNQENTLALQEMTTAHDLATGAISKHDAAVQEAALHAATYTAKLKDLKDEQDADDNDASLTPEQRKGNTAERGIETEKVEGEAQRTALQDSWAAKQQTAAGGFIDALQELAVAGKDTAAQFKSITNELVDGVNKTIVEELTSPNRNHSPRYLWTHLGHDAATSVAGKVLEHGESSLLDATGVLGGKNSKAASWLGLAGAAKLGTPANPMYVKSVDKLDAGGESSPLNLFGGRSNSFGRSGDQGSGDIFGDLFGGGEGSGSSIDSSDAGNSGMGDLVEGLLGSLPGFASGVTNFSGGLAVVGERGPEVVNLPGGASVIPNGASAKKLSRAGDIHFHPGAIDARGATDPATVNALVQRGIMQAAPHLIAASMRAQTDRNRRLPSIRRM